MQPTSARIEQIPPNAGQSETTTSQTFPLLSPSIPRNFMVTDTYCETPPAGVSSVSYDRHASVLANTDHSSDFLAPFRGLGAISDDVKDCLPPECREAFEQALGQEKNWHAVRSMNFLSSCCKGLVEPILTKRDVFSNGEQRRVPSQGAILSSTRRLFPTVYSDERAVWIQRWCLGLTLYLSEGNGRPWRNAKESYYVAHRFQGYFPRNS